MRMLISTMLFAMLVACGPSIEEVRQIVRTEIALTDFPDGPPGPQGERGLQGIPGERGERGMQGDQGPRGLAGIQGPQGERGLTGRQRNPGERGPTGHEGHAGLDAQIPSYLELDGLAVKKIWIMDADEDKRMVLDVDKVKSWPMISFLPKPSSDTLGASVTLTEEGDLLIVSTHGYIVCADHTYREYAHTLFTLCGEGWVKEIQAPYMEGQ